MAQPDDRVKSDFFHYKGKTYDTEPGTMERLKEGFSTTDDRAQIEAIRRARQAAYKAGAVQ